MDRDKVATPRWPHGAATQGTQMASLAIVMLGACPVSFLVSIFPAQSSAGKPLIRRASAAIDGTAFRLRDQ